MSIDLNLSADQRQILDAAGAMLAENFPVMRLRNGGADDIAPLVELGAFALALPEAAGGAGLTLVDEALLHELLGRHLVSTRAVATALASRLLVASGSDLAEGVLSGALPVCAALPSDKGLLLIDPRGVGSSRVDLQACKLEYSIVSPK